MIKTHWLHLVVDSFLAKISNMDPLIQGKKEWLLVKLHSKMATKHNEIIDNSTNNPLASYHFLVWTKIAYTIHSQYNPNQDPQIQYLKLPNHITAMDMDLNSVGGLVDVSCSTMNPPCNGSAASYPCSNGQETSSSLQLMPRDGCLARQCPSTEARHHRGGGGG